MREADWGAPGPFDAIVAINMIHIAPWEATQGLMAGAARLLAPGKVEVQGTGPEAGKTFLVEAAHIVIATGARPVEIPGFAFSGNRVVDSTGALAFTEVPRRLVVIGAGYIGMEIGTLYAKLGSRVTFVEALPTILSGNEPDCVQVVARKAKKFKFTPCMGRTHGVHAEPTTFGLKMALMYDEFGRCLTRLQAARKTVSVGQLSGAVGTHAHLEPFVEHTNQLVTVLNTQEGALHLLVRNTGVVFNALASRDNQLEQFIVNGERTFLSPVLRPIEAVLYWVGGIDDKRTWNPAAIKGAHNYVRAALDESLAGKPVTVASATPYG